MWVLECVINVSEGNPIEIGPIAMTARDALWDVHSDLHHNRSVLTLGGPDVEAAARRVATAAFKTLDIRTHVGAHPRIGVVDVVPFVPLSGSTMADAVRARDEFATWFTAAHGVPCFLYGPERSLPDVRREAAGVPGHVTAGACAVGARPVLVAYNVWLADGVDVTTAESIAASLRQPGKVRALGFDVGGRAQVSCNLLAPDECGPLEVYAAVSAKAPAVGGELVGLIPDAVLHRIPKTQWAQLGLAEARTIESHVG